MIADPDLSTGFPVVELLIVLVVLAILTALAVMALGSSTEHLERQNIAKEFKVALERARFDSVKRRASRCSDMARVEITSATTFDLITDVTQNGTTLLDNGTPSDPSDDTVTDPVEIRTVDFTGRDVEIVSDPDDPPPVYPIIIGLIDAVIRRRELVGLKPR